jgi:hypothetical protein
MVAKINSSKSLSGTLNYNEQKLLKGKAQLLEAAGFLKDPAALSFSEKLHHFQQLTALNERTRTHAVHISLNFDPSEKLSTEKLSAIAKSYMHQIDFSAQPYLVYQHFDSGHPHIHIVSTNIRSDGSRISLHNMGKNQSEKARREIEQSFGLKRAEAGKRTQEINLKPVNAQKVLYGKTQTRKAIENVLALVLNQYTYTSLPELNAVLQLYNVTAERGGEESRQYQRGGLTYRVLNERGAKVGVPIKASALALKATLPFLEQKFRENETIRKQHLPKLKTTLDWTLSGKTESLDAFIKALERERISTVLRKGKEGVIYGLTYVDHRTYCVCNGSDLGKQYSAKAILERFHHGINTKHTPVVLHQNTEKGEAMIPSSRGKLSMHESPKQNIVEVMITPTATNDYLPYPFKQKRKKKTKSHHH